jgi:hypothetical protein
MSDDEILNIKKQKKVLEEKLTNTLVIKAIKIFNDNVDVHNGIGITELTSKLFKKSYVTDKEGKEAYKIIVLVRKVESNKCLAYKNQKYGWAITKEDIDSNTIKNTINGFSKIKSNYDGIHRYYKYLGIQSDPSSLFKLEAKNFKFKLNYEGDKN